MNRKRTGLYIVSLCILIFFPGCNREAPITETEFLLGTTCSITLYRSGNKKALRSAFDRVRELENRMSVNIDESEVSEINRMAGQNPVFVSDETYDLIEKAIKIARETEGALDISIGPLVVEWKIGTDEANVPPDRVITELLTLVNFEDIRLDPENKTVFLHRRGMQIDLGAIAKGCAADEAVKTLQEAGIDRGIIDLGGNIKVFGEKKSKEPWRIGIQKPDDGRGVFFGIARVESGSVVSSGTYERFFVQDDVRYHHILDPATGFPVANGLESVTIITNSAADADGYSTAVFVLGLEKGYSFIRNTSGIEAVFVTDEKQIFITGGLQNTFMQRDADFTIIPFSERPRVQ